MRIIKFIFLIFLISSLSISASALNLDVDNELVNFVDENLLNNKNNDSLTNPFFVEISETKNQEENLDLDREDFREQNNSLFEPGSEEVVQQKDKALLTINGVISASNNKTALLINYQNTNHVLKIGDSLDNYKLVSYQKEEATFIRNGNSIKISY